MADKPGKAGVWSLEISFVSWNSSRYLSWRALGVAAAAGEKVNIAGDGAFAAPTGSACCIVQLLLLYLGDWPTSDCFLAR